MVADRTRDIPEKSVVLTIVAAAESMLHGQWGLACAAVDTLRNVGRDKRLAKDDDEDGNDGKNRDEADL